MTRASVVKVAIGEVHIRGERFIFLSNSARAYLAHFGATPKPPNEDRKAIDEGREER